MSKIDWLNDYKRATGCTLGDARRAWEQMYAKMAEDTELRDRAALALLPALVTQDAALRTAQAAGIPLHEVVAVLAFSYADAFIAARETKEGEG
jgi:hypothetical protein